MLPLLAQLRLETAVPTEAISQRRVGQVKDLTYRTR